jgi:hypothetical protein
MKISKQEALDIAFNGITYLSRIIDDNGKFIYQYEEKDGFPSNYNPDKYNLLRHAGCTWSMFYFLNNYHTKDMFIFNKGLKALEYLIKNNLKRISFLGGLYYPCYKEEIKTGCIGLSLLAFDEAFENTYEKNKNKWERHLENSSNLINSILYLQQPSGGFRWYKYNISLREPTPFISDFYDGECALALLKAANKNDEKKIILAAKKLILWKYTNRKQSTRDHWMLQAIESFPIAYLDKEEKDIFSRFANSITDRIIKDPYDPSIYDVYGSIACRSEALLSYLEIMRKGLLKTVFKKDEIMETLNKFLLFQKEGQVLSGLSKGAWKQNRKSNMIRCDFTQHNSMAFLRYASMERR